MGEPETKFEIYKNQNEANLLNSPYNTQNSNILTTNKFKKHNRNYSSNSYLTTKTDDMNENKFKNLGGGFCKSASVRNFNINSYFIEDNLFEELKSRGMMDADLDSKISEYKSNLSNNSNIIPAGDNNNNLSLKIEFNILKSSLEGASNQYNNLQSVISIKEKKIEILETALNNIQKKKMRVEAEKKENEVSLVNYTLQSTEKVNNITTANNFKRNRKTNSVNIVNVSELMLEKANHQTNYNKNINTLEEQNNVNVSFKYCNDYTVTDINLLKQELNQLRKTEYDELNTLRDNLNKTFQVQIKNEKMKFEEKLREINSDNCFLTNSLLNEINFMKNKIKAKQENFIEIRKQKDEIDICNSNFIQKKNNLIEQLNYYKSLISNLNNSNYIVGTHSVLNTVSENQQRLHTNDLKIFLNNSGNSLNRKTVNSNCSNKATKGNMKKTHSRSQSHSSNLLNNKQNSLELLSNIEYDISYNTNQESFRTTNKESNNNLSTLKLNYALDSQEMRPYPQISKSSNQKISFDTKQSQNSLVNIKVSKKNSNNNSINKDYQKKVTINIEDYMSTTTVQAVNPIRAFNSKFLSN